MTRRWSALPILLWTFAACLAVATVLALALGFDLLVPPPSIPETLDFPSRLQALAPFQAAIWPFDAASTLLYVIGFGALALAAGPIAQLAGDDPIAGVLRTSILASGLVGVIAGLLYFGGMQVMAMGYCDCGFKNEETISRFWAITIVQGATNALGYGAIVFGAVGVAISASALGRRGLPRIWRDVAWSAAALLFASVLFHELSDTPIGDLLAAVASGVLLPAWALVLARRLGRLAPVQS